MKYIMMSVVFLSSSYALAYTFSDQGCTEAQIQSAKEEVKLAQDRLKVGEITTTDLAIAEMKVLETTYCSEAPNYWSVSCLEMTSNQQIILNGYQKELLVAGRRFKDYGAELTKAGALFTFCDGRAF